MLAPDVPGRRRVEGVKAAQEVAVGRAHACARTASGAVLCWDLAGAPGRAVEETGGAGDTVIASLFGLA